VPTVADPFSPDHFPVELRSRMFKMQALLRVALPLTVLCSREPRVPEVRVVERA
jgi:hypothetical protein